MHSFPARWILAADASWLRLVEEIENHLDTWGQGPVDGIPVIVWDGAAPLPPLTATEAPNSEIPRLLLLGPGPFGSVPTSISAHLLAPDAQQLWAAIVALANGIAIAPGTGRTGVTVSDSPVEDNAERSTGATGAGSSTVTPREQEVLECIARGLPNKTIAAELGIGLGTVKFHLSNLMEKFAAQNRAELVMEAAREGYLTV